jgi:RNA polymerase sigma factor (sigma-70 family)
MPANQLHQDSMADLLARAGTGDSRAFGRLYQLAMPGLRRQAMKIVRRSELADEVLQEGFMAIWRDARHYSAARAAPMTWMTAIVRNKAFDLLRSSHARSKATGCDEYGSLADAQCDPGLGPCELAEHAQQIVLVGCGLARLEASHRRAIELAFFQELTHAEVALHMTIPLGTVKTWIRRGCTTLRRQMLAPKGLGR